MEEVADIDLVSRSRLEELPDVLLQHRVFPLLDATALGRLACCNSRLNIAALADHLWYPLFVQNNSSLIHRNPKHYNKKGFNDPPPYPWQTWHQAFSSKQNIRCVECKEHTPYVFTLLPSNVRLCERCEYTCPKYALVTEREARGHYLLDDEELRSLQFKKVKIKKFDVYLFLRSAVETLAHGKGAEFEGRDLFRRDKHEEEKNSNFMEASCSESSVEGWTQVDENGGETNNDPDDSETLAEEISNTMVLSKMNKNEKSFHGSAELSQDMLVQGLENAENAFDREGRKALRKKHKQQVKAENREKRMGKKMGRSPHGEHSFAENSGKKSLHLKEIEDADENSDVGDRDKVKKKHRRTKRDHVSASKGVYRQEQFLGYNSQLTTKSLSDWVQERDWLESELGRNGISALELAQF